MTIVNKIRLHFLKLKDIPVKFADYLHHIIGDVFHCLLDTARFSSLLLHSHARHIADTIAYASLIPSGWMRDILARLHASSTDMAKNPTGLTRIPLPLPNIITTIRTPI